MSDKPGTADAELESDELRQQRLLRTILLASMAVGWPSAGIFLVMGITTPKFPGLELAGLMVFFSVACLVSLLLLRRGAVRWAALVYLLPMATAALAINLFADGVTGPFAPSLIVVPLAAGMLVGRSAARNLAIVEGGLYLGMAILEGEGILRPHQLAPEMLRPMTHVGLLVTLALVLLFANRAADQLRRALARTEHHSVQLAAARAQADNAARAEREAREREEGLAGELHRTVRRYADFMKRVSAGDYGLRLEIEQGEEDRYGELASLGRGLNETVDALTHVLNELRAVQRLYLRQAWSEYGAGSGVSRGLRCDGAGIEPADEAWLPSIASAVHDRAPAVGDDELALPIALRGEVLGALGARRPGRQGWSEEDVALAQAAVDQLSQTIENLRLIDESQRRAAREEFVGQASDRMLRAADLGALLRVAGDELQRTFGASHVLVELGSEVDLAGGRRDGGLATAESEP